MNHQTIKPILQRLKDSLQQLYGERLIDVILFGSYAKQTAHQDSDIDVLIVLAEEFNLDLEMARTSHLIANFCLEYNILISRLFMSQTYYQTHKSALMKNIHQEGIKL
jgi:predicted nucleotidyltransferase